ncbi:hypothetical protein [Hyphomonas sp.]|uniref:hypothetical protein n=1 Tax=Hyphomonas sp. TaxID=87 RepID=UPI0025C4AEBA|nr:hypothetical protein [Hyphomonas sp.]
MSKYPPGYFGLREWLGPPIGLMFELRQDPAFPNRLRASLKAVSLQLVGLVDDDELGLIDTSPEERMRSAQQWRERKDD